MTSSIFDKELSNFQSKLDSEEGIEQAKVALRAAHDNEVGGLLLGLAVPAAKAFGTRAFKLGEENLRAVIKGTKLEKVTSKLEELKARSEGRKPASEPTEETPEDTEETTGNFSGDNPAFDPDAAPEDDDVPEFEEPPGDLGIELDDIPSAITSADASAGDLSGVSDEALQGMLDVVNGRVGSINALTEQEFGFASQAREQAVQAGLAADEEMAAANPLDIPAEISGGLRGDSTIARAVLNPEEAADFTGETADGISAGISEATEAATAGISTATEGISAGISAATEGVSTAASAGADAIAATGDTLLATGAALDATGVGAIVGTGLAVAGAAVSLYEGFKDIFEHHDAAPPAPVSQAVFEPGAISSLG